MLPAAPQPLLCQPLAGLYSLPYLEQRLPEAAEPLSRPEWWELLFFVRKLQAQEQEEITRLIQQHRGEQVGAGACSRDRGREEQRERWGREQRQRRWQLWAVRGQAERGGRKGRVSGAGESVESPAQQSRGCRAEQRRRVCPGRQRGRAAHGFGQAGTAVGSFCRLRWGAERGWGQPGDGGSGERPWAAVAVQPLCPLCRWPPAGPWGVWRARINLSPWLRLAEVQQEALEQLSVPAELAQKVLRALEKRCRGSSLRDLRGSRVYARHRLARGAERDGGGGPAVSPEGESGPEGSMAEAAEGELCAAPGQPRGRGAALESDSQLFSELWEREGLLVPEAPEEQSQGNVPPGAGHREGSGPGPCSGASLERGCRGCRLRGSWQPGSRRRCHRCPDASVPPCGQGWAAPRARLRAARWPRLRPCWR